MLIPDETTPDLWKLSRQIRDYGHNPRHIERLHSIRFDWHQLWTALDIIDDVDLAIKAYVDADFPSTPGEQYLRVFGIFQALFVQQDALRHFVEVILPGSPIVLVDVLKDVREARNASVGHPSELSVAAKYLLMASIAPRWEKTASNSCPIPRRQTCLFSTCLSWS